MSPEELPGIVELPEDPDVEVAETATGQPRPLHLHPVSLLLVFTGGVVGVAAREGLMQLFPVAGGFPWVIFAINLSGAFLLGVLLEALARRGPDHGRRRSLRLLLGTGVIGGYTTYSSLANAIALLLGQGETATAFAYALGTVVLGGVATWMGIVAAIITHRPRPGVTR